MTRYLPLVVLFWFLAGGISVAHAQGSTSPFRTITRYADPQTRSVVREVYTARVTTTDTVRHGPSRLLYRSGKVEALGFYTNGKPDSTLTEFYESGQKRLEVQWHKGLKEGAFTAWDTHGVPLQQGTFLHNEQTGPFRTFYPDGQVKTAANFVNGFPEGVVQAFDPAGKLVSEVTYQKHLPNGPSRTFWPNGQVKSERLLRNGQPDGPDKTWYENGQVASETVTAPGAKTGKLRAYYPSGKLQRESAYKSVTIAPTTATYSIAEVPGKPKKREVRDAPPGTTAASDGPATEYFEDGTVAGRITYKLGVKVGTEQFFYPGGKLREETAYRNEGRDYDRSSYYESGNPKAEEHVVEAQRTGEWPTYNDGPNKPLQELARYTRNRLAGEQATYHPTGAVASRGFREGGRRVGLWTDYGPDGKATTETSWKNGAKNGPYRELRPDGRPRVTGSWANNLQSGLWTWYDDEAAPTRPTRTATFRRGVEIEGKVTPKKGR